jgi:hypothetical protein
MNLTRTNWPLGWTPSADAVNGNPNGLLRADNLRIDKEGVTGLIDGHQIIGTSVTFASKFHTKIVNGVEFLWTAYGLPVQSIVRTQGFFGATPLLPVGAGIPNGHAFFGDALGNVLIAAGNYRAKDPITSTAKPLGILTPVAVSGKGPSGFVNPPSNIALSGPDSVILGTGSPSSVTTIESDPGVSGIWEAAVATPATDRDSTSLGNARLDRDIGEDTVEFLCQLTGNSPELVTKIIVDILLDGSPSNPNTYSNYYEFVFEGSDLPSGEGIAGTISQKRRQAVRYGNDNTKNWSGIVGARYLIVAEGEITAYFGSIVFRGGANGGLNGVYQYIQQDVTDNGVYIAKGPVSELAYNNSEGTTRFNVNIGSVTLTPLFTNPTTQISAHRFYRKAVSDLGIDPNTGESLNTSFLNQFYYVGEISAGAAAAGQRFTDMLSDEEVLQLNADGSFLPNLYLKTLRTADAANGLFDAILGIEGLHKDRMLYLGASYVYISDVLNPDAIDSRFTLKPSGDSSEKNLWIKQITNDTIILATTKNLYEISGSFAELPDGTIDVAIRPIGEAYPPLSGDVCRYEGGLFYIAADGLRVTNGSNSTNVSPQLREFFKSFTLIAAPRTKKVHGVPIASIYPGSGVYYSIAAAHQKIYFQIPCQDSTRRLIYFDTVTKTYGLMYADPVALHGTQAGELIASFNHGYSDGSTLPSMWLLDTIPGYGYSGSQGMPIRLRTVFDDNQQPRNRKDTFTLKLVMDTGGRRVSVDVQKDGTGVTENDETDWTNLGYYATSGQQTVYINLSHTEISLGFRYALQITDVEGLYTFKLYEATIEYEPRPEQVNHLRLLPTNLGTMSRKRWTAFAVVIDTLGNAITFTPYLDNVAWSTSGTATTDTKLTYIFYFDSEAVATDMGGIFTGGTFEFYSINLEECISEKLPTPTTYLIIPGNNYGTPNRKRHTSYKFQINTRGSDVTFTPVLDGTSYSSTTYNTTRKQTVDYYFPQSDGDVIGVDIGGILESAESPKEPFEFYGVVVPQTVESLPDRLEYLRIPNSNFGIADRKRIRTISLILDTRGQPVVFTPYVDNQPHSVSSTFTTTGKSTVWFYFHSDTVGVDFGGVLSTDTGQDFEFYGLGTPDNVEPLPLPVTYFIIPPNNYGTPNRKRHTSYKWQMITRGSRVKFTPRLDQVEYEPEYYTTTVKQVCEYFFPERAPLAFNDYPGGGDVIGIDVGGVLESVEDPPVPFEFYEVVTPQKIEVLPDRLQYLRIPNTNFGVAARKRVRTIPIVIDTYGYRVRYTPIVDDRLYPHSIFQTYSKTTVHHFFDQDVFGTDFGGILSCE